ncbi:MAG: hypothetical protein LIO86_14310 [Lachnospiraceae bacterium]|nr:hypothetical protein [Lachnospiraceae bacterium]
MEKRNGIKKYNNFDLHFRFERKRESVNFPNAEYVHPLKQDLVQRLQTDFKEDANIRTVIVFGSSVEFRCNSFSDLDLCIERSESSKFFHSKSEEPGERIDIVYADCMGERLRQEVEKKGIVVFDREGLYV